MELAGGPGAFNIVPPLEEVELYRCTSAVNDWTLALMKRLKSQPEWTKFSRLSVESCSAIEQEPLLVLIPREKLEWVDVASDDPDVPVLLVGR